MNNEIIIGEYRLVLTCSCCPEQYDVFDSANNKVGYLRLRHGAFTVDYPDCMCETIYTAYPNGDGAFQDEEIDYYLHRAIMAIDNKIKENR